MQMSLDNDVSFAAIKVALEVVLDKPLQNVSWHENDTHNLRLTCKTVKEDIDKMKLPIKVSVSFTASDRFERRLFEKVGIALNKNYKLSNLRTITNLQFKSCGIKTGLLLTKFLTLLGNCPNVNTIDLEDNIIGAEGINRFADMLLQCPELQKLNLSCNWIGDNGAIRLASVLSQCTTLTDLNLGVNNIKIEGASWLAGVLPQCTALTKLDLYYNQLGNNGIVFFEEMLLKCTRLTHLNLGNNQLGDTGTTWLANMLPQCHNLALTNLILDANDIGYYGTVSLANMIPKCTTLTILDLNYNPINDETSDLLGVVLIEYPNLQCFRREL
jgi:Ran GTPase-activating protein (RanGAP) involved in mRNA processing and transport